MVKVAIIGTGYISNFHLNSYEKIDNVEIVGIISRSIEKGKDTAKKYKTKIFNNLDTFLEKEEVDMVDVCTPTYTHAKYVIKAVNAGKNVLCEAPISLSIKEAEKMIKAVKINKVKAMVGHTLRFWPEYIKVKEILDSGRIGKLKHCFCQRLSATPKWHAGGWGLREKYGGGAPMDLQIHDLDFIISIFGKPKTIWSTGIKDYKSGNLVYINTNLEFSNNRSAYTEAGWNFKGNFPFIMGFRIICDEGTIEWFFRADEYNSDNQMKPEIHIYWANGLIEKITADQTDAYLIELKYFINSVINNTPIDRASFFNGKKALELTIASIESVRKRKRIVIK